jgi:hypothetical protein
MMLMAEEIMIVVIETTVIVDWKRFLPVKHQHEESA